MRSLVALLVFLASSYGVQSQTIHDFVALDECKTWSCAVAQLTDTSTRSNLTVTIPWRLPLRDSGRISSGYGMREHPILGGSRFHAGLDLAAPMATPVYASASGLARAGYDDVLGHHVTVDHLNGFSTTYGHLSALAIAEPAFVTSEDLLGLVGASGRATGPHVHWTVRYRGAPIDPVALREAVHEAFY